MRWVLKQVFRAIRIHLLSIVRSLLAHITTPQLRRFQVMSDIYRWSYTDYESYLISTMISVVKCSISLNHYMLSTWEVQEEPHQHYKNELCIPDL